MKEECNCYRKGETKRVCDPECDCYCHSINQESTSSWEVNLDAIEKEYPMAMTNWSTEDWKSYIRKLLKLERQKAKEETLSIVLQEIDLFKERLARTGQLDKDYTYKDKLQDIDLHHVVTSLYEP